MGHEHHHNLADKMEQIADKVRSMVHGIDDKLPCPIANSLPPHANEVLKHPDEKDFLSRMSPQNIQDLPLTSFDSGVFNNELLALELYSTVDPHDPTKAVGPKGNIVQGTYTGTQVALTQLYQRIEQT